MRSGCFEVDAGVMGCEVRGEGAWGGGVWGRKEGGAWGCCGVSS